MRRRQLLIGVLLAFMVGNLSVVLLGWDSDFPEFSFVLLFGTAFAEVGLLSVWMVLGYWNLLLRAALLLGAVAALSQPLGAAVGDSYAQWMGVLSAFAAMTALPSLLLRVNGWKLTRVALPSAPPVRELADAQPAGDATADGNSPRVDEDADPGTDPGTDAVEHDASSQFSLGSLLALITAVGLFLALVRIMDFPFSQATEVLLYLLGFAAVTVFCLWAVWGIQPRLVRVAVALPAVPAIGFGLSWIENTPRFGMVAIVLVQGLVTVACLAAVHFAGLRLRRRVRRDPHPRPSVADARRPSSPGMGEPPSVSPFADRGQATQEAQHDGGDVETGEDADREAGGTGQPSS